MLFIGVTVRGKVGFRVRMRVRGARAMVRVREL